MEYLEKGSEDCPLIRLYEFNSIDIQRLRAAVTRLMDGSISRFKLEEIVPVTSIGGVELAFVQGNSDRGVACAGKNAFEVVLASEGWDRVLGLLEPFVSRVPVINGSVRTGRRIFYCRMMAVGESILG